jgi:hypothetical protein
MAACGESKWGVPAAEQTWFTGTVWPVAPPPVSAHGTVVLVVGAAEAPDAGGVVVAPDACGAAEAAGTEVDTLEGAVDPEMLVEVCRLVWRPHPVMRISRIAKPPPSVSSLPLLIMADGTSGGAPFVGTLPERSAQMPL